MAFHRIYLDHNATTPVRTDVLDAMLPWLREKQGNPSSLHGFGREARVAIEAAREEVAALINAEPEQIIFTSGATEANNLALKGLCDRYGGPARPHIVTTGVEHESVLGTARYLEAFRGCEVSFLPVDPYGMVSPQHVFEAITNRTVVVSVAHGNNETGTLLPIREIGAVCRERSIPFHTDAVQTVGKVRVDVKALDIGLLSLSAHKLYGPKGVGALYVRRGVKLIPQQQGGAQERSLRAGTENVAGIIGCGTACRLAGAELHDMGRHLALLRDELERRMFAAIPGVVLNGHPTERVQGTLNVSFEGIESEGIIENLDLQGIAVSNGSACSSGAAEPSHVLRAMGRSEQLARASVRFSFGRDNTMGDVDRIMEVLPGIVERMRACTHIEA